MNTTRARCIAERRALAALGFIPIRVRAPLLPDSIDSLKYARDAMRDAMRAAEEPLRPPWSTVINPEGHRAYAERLKRLDEEHWLS